MTSNPFPLVIFHVSNRSFLSPGKVLNTARELSTLPPTRQTVQNMATQSGDEGAGGSGLAYEQTPAAVYLSIPVSVLRSISLNQQDLSEIQRVCKPAVKIAKCIIDAAVPLMKRSIPLGQELYSNEPSQNTKNRRAVLRKLQVLQVSFLFFSSPFVNVEIGKGKKNK